MKIACDIIAYIALAFTVIGLLSKNKDRCMLFISIYNLLILLTYILMGLLSGSIMVVIASARSITFYIFSKKKIKPNIFVFLGFEIVSIVALALSWESLLSIILLVNLVLTTFTNWQNNMTILRLGMAISGVLLIVYDICVGAYTLIISESIFLLSALISIVKYDIVGRISKKSEIEIKHEEGESVWII